MSDVQHTVRAENLTKIYKLVGETIYALNSLNMKVKEGEFIIIMGPSGSGKTTFLNMIGALDRPTSGEVYIDERPLSKMNQKELASFRTFKIGFVFQTFNLIPALTALDNVMVPMVFAGHSRNDRKKKAIEKLKLVDLEDRLHHRPDQLSGGQQQRVAIARALANDPSLVLADEPTANLDLTTGFQIVELLRRLNQETGVTVINSTHDLKLIDIADKISWIRDGKITRTQEKISVEITGDEITI